MSAMFSKDSMSMKFKFEKALSQPCVVCRMKNPTFVLTVEEETPDSSSCLSHPICSNDCAARAIRDFLLRGEAR